MRVGFIKVNQCSVKNQEASKIPLLHCVGSGSRRKKHSPFRPPILHYSKAAKKCIILFLLCTRQPTNQEDTNES